MFSKMKGKSLLIIDDDHNTLEILSSFFKDEGYEVFTATNGKSGLMCFNTNLPNLVLTDLKMPKMDGIEVLREVKKVTPNVPVIMVTAYGTIESAVTAMKLGAYDFILKPFNLKEIKELVERAMKVEEKEREVFSYFTSTEEENIIGFSSVMKEIYRTVEKVAKSIVSVCIIGETGVGKELIAKAIHYKSERSSHPFIKLNCAAIPENLLESELFGYEKGAFTGAYTTKPGKFELAHKGTLFLDEIGDLSLVNQSKLLRVIQEKEFERVGGLKTIKVDARLITATSKDLEECIKNKTFREDLYYRISVVRIFIPPLRERKEDINELIRFFIKKFSKREKKEIKGIEKETLHILLEYNWPGNIRELENVIESMVVLSEISYLTPTDIPYHIRAHTSPPIKGSSLEVAEINAIKEALRKTSFNKTKAASLLKINRKTLLSKLKKYNITI